MNLSFQVNDIVKTCSNWRHSPSNLSVYCTRFGICYPHLEVEPCSFSFNLPFFFMMALNRTSPQHATWVLLVDWRIFLYFSFQCFFTATLSLAGNIYIWGLLKQLNSNLTYLIIRLEMGTLTQLGSWRNQPDPNYYIGFNLGWPMNYKLVGFGWLTSDKSNSKHKVNMNRPSC